MTRRTPAACALAVALTLASFAHADPGAPAASLDPVAAESLFNEGRTLLEEGRLDEACEHFARSQQLDPAVGTLKNLGDCYERMGRLATAWSTFRQTESLAVARQDDRRAALAREAAARIEPRVPRLRLTLEGDTPGLSVTRNGTPVSGVFDIPIPVDPGEYTIVAAAPDHKTWRRIVTLGEGAKETLRIPRLSKALSVDDARSERPGRAQRDVALGLEIGGGAFLAAGLVFGGMAIAKWSSVTDTCPGARCPTDALTASLSGDVSTARTFATLGTIGVAAGAAALATGIVLHVTSPKRRLSIGPASPGGGIGLVTSVHLE